MAKQLVVRIDPELKDKVATLARVEGKTSSQVIRELLEEYVKKRDMGSYIDGLWDRIRQQLEAEGAQQSDVAEAVQKVREGR
ncbi:MAG: ribbon-helix-helix protein, CopG family [Desulfohalobiaceae bacterium]